MNIALKTIITAIFVLVLCFAISSTVNEAWLTVWFLLFFFVGIPFSFLVLKDLLVVVAPRWIGPSQLLLHICALFGALVGYGLGAMAVSTEHQMAHLHQLMVVVFPLMVYATPLLMTLNGIPLSRVKRFYFKSHGNE
ncbi:hypothetical protein [Zooshikella ganghwensis]|uniref:Uncharacterized protein n=1 Tax=Zooshikella ganghwensis TaxID=202772 RepID=A0A4P9VSI4_9GAMM|nr:hypothetical protein [Zooshikella ganghwensis]RDH45627.1 hypothetical protein B9G39_20430 [Zooshikella ganghwensis]